MTPLAVGSLFAGIGGIELGLEWTGGFETKWQVEIDEYARRVLERHWPGVRRYEDVRQVGKHNLEAVDLICGGFPCPPVSVAGRQRGLEDERWLWPEFARVVRELRPRYVLAENVPGILSVDAGRCFGAVLRDLAAAGYDAEWTVLSALEVGAPHLRKRVFIVGYLADAKSAGLAVGQSEEVGDAQRTGSLRGLTRQSVSREPDQGWWSTEPDVGRVAHGIPTRVDRLRCLGNAVVPQCARWVGQQILRYEALQ